MRIKRKKPNVSIVLIPDADMPVRRWRFSRMWLYAVPVILVSALISASVFLYQNKMHSLRTKDEVTKQFRGVTQQLNKENDDLEHTLLDKELTIDRLVNEIESLTQQAQSLKAQMEELGKMEQELRELSPLAANGEDSSTEEVERLAEGGVGGVYILSDPSDADTRMEEARAAYEKLHKDLSNISTKMNEVKAAIEELAHYNRVTPSIWPVSQRQISSSFGYRKDPFTGRRTFHGGIDIPGKMNDAILAAADGIVSETGRDGSRGRYIILRHENGIRTVYMHLNKILVEEGEKVAQRDKIGLMGSSGRSTAPHLHYEVLINGKETNPKPYLKPSIQKG